MLKVDKLSIFAFLFHFENETRMEDKHQTHSWAIYFSIGHKAKQTNNHLDPASLARCWKLLLVFSGALRALNWKMGDFLSFLYVQRSRRSKTYLKTSNLRLEIKTSDTAAKRIIKRWFMQSLSWGAPYMWSTY